MINLFRWRQSISFVKILQNLLSSFGFLWLLIEISSYFSQQARNCLPSYWWFFLIMGVIYTLYSSRPKNSFSYKLSSRDVVIEVQIADIFKIPGAIVVPINTAFDTNLDGHISKANSIQGSLLRNYYDSKIEHLELDITEQLRKEAGNEKPDNKKQYDIGTVIQIHKKKQLFYLFASSNINNNDRAVSTKEDLNIALTKLWEYISKNGDKCDVVIPIVGTGHARLPLKRQEVFINIVQTFITSCLSKIYCNKLVIVLYPPDVEKYNINIDDLDAVLRCLCQA